MRRHTRTLGTALASSTVVENHDRVRVREADVLPFPRPAAGQQAGAPASPPPRLLERVRTALRTRHYSERTEKAYVGWIRRFILFHDKRHPDTLAEPEIVAFLSHLADPGMVSASTQNQALAALLFLYQAVLGRQLAWLGNVVHAKRPARLPVVLTRAESRALLDRLAGPYRIVGGLLYGGGLRLLEALQLRIKDVDLAQREILVRDGKGRRDRRTLVPEALVVPVHEHLTRHPPPTRRRSGRRERRRCAPRRPPPKVRCGATPVGMAMAVSCHALLSRCRHGRAAAPPPPRNSRPACFRRRRPRRRHHQARNPPHPPP